MQNLEKRIAALESANPPADEITIIRKFVSPGHLDEEIQELHDWKGCQQWKRQPGESEQEFIDRATREVKRDGPGCALLMAGH